MHDYYIKNDKQLFWNRNMIATFIQLYKENECLYNSKHPDYKSQAVKTDALKNILLKLKPFLPNLQLKDVQDKLKAIRKQFIAEVSLVDEAAAEGNTYVPKLWCFKELDFLRSHIDCSGNDCSDSNEDNKDSDDGQSDTSDISYDFNYIKTIPEYRWEREDTKIFIGLLKQFKILCDVQHKNYNNIKLRHKACILLTKEAQKIDPKINIQAVKIKIKTIRSQYLSELRRIKKAKENNEPYTPRLWCFDLLNSLYKNNTTDTKSNECVPSNETILYTEFDNSNNSNEQLSNETYEIEPIHQVIIENEMEYDEEVPNTYATQTNQTVIDYECENTFDYVSEDLQQCDYKEENNKNETNFTAEKIQFVHPDIEAKPVNSKDSLNNVEVAKYEWLGDLVTSQLGLISSKYHDQLASDVENLIQKYKERSKTIEDNSKQSNVPHDAFLQDTPNVSFNLRIL